MRKILACSVTLLFLLSACGGGSSGGNTDPANVSPDNVVPFAEGALGAGDLGYYGGPFGLMLFEGMLD